MPTTSAPRTERIAMLGTLLARLDPPNVVGARRSLARAREQLARVQRAGAAGDVVEAFRYRVDRAFDVLREAERMPAHA